MHTFHRKDLCKSEMLSIKGFHLPLARATLSTLGSVLISYLWAFLFDASRWWMSDQHSLTTCFDMLFHSARSFFSSIPSYDLFFFSFFFLSLIHNDSGDSDEDFHVSNHL